MKIILIVLASLIVLIGVMVLIGAFLPRTHVATREITLRPDPANVYAVVRDFASARSWRAGLERVEMLENVDGQTRFREHSKDGVITYELVDDIPGERLTTRIVDRDLGYFGSWTYGFLPAESGTRLRITENGEVPNVLFRFVSRFVFGHTATMDAYLTALARKVGEDRAPN
jgi:hypothetical protein